MKHFITNADREHSLSLLMGEEERHRVARAILHRDAVRMDNTERERQRCLAICAQWPDNLLAREIARLIAKP